MKRRQFVKDATSMAARFTMIPDLSMASAVSANKKDSFAYIYGIGGAVNGERIPAYHHHGGENTKSKLFLIGCSHPVINDDPNMTKYTERKAWLGLDKILLGGKVNHGNAGYEYLNPGIRLKANDNWWTTVTMPGENNDKHSYFRCPTGKKYKVSIDLDVKDKGKQRLWLRLHVYNIDGRVLRIVQSDDIKLSNGKQQLESVFKVPEINDFETIYNNPASDNLVNIAIEASFADMKTDVDIFALKLEQLNDHQTTLGAGVIIDDKKHHVDGLLEKGKIIQIPIETPLKPRSVNELMAVGNKRVTYLVRHSDMKWQIRNAIATYIKDYIEIDKIRNHISDKMEIVIVPLQAQTAPYLHRIRKAEQIRYFPFSIKNKTLKIEIKKVYKEAELEIFSRIKPSQISCVASWTYTGNIILAKLDRPENIQIEF